MSASFATSDTFPSIAARALPDAGMEPVEGRPDRGVGAEPRPGARGKLVTLEAGRFFAAVAVLLYHYTRVVADFRGGVLVFGDLFRPGHVGVPYFFVLSGFIIYHVHRRDIGRHRRLANFALRRAIRLYPMFWAVSLAILLGFLVKPGLGGGRTVTGGGLIADLLLLPHADALLAISWTLRHEMVFYLLFGCAVLFGRPALALVAAWAVVSLLGAIWAPQEMVLGSWSIINATLNLGFVAGIAAAATLARRAVVPASAWIAAGGGGFAALCVLEWLVGRGVPHSVEVLGVAGDLGYLATAAMLIHGLARLEEHWTMPAAGTWKVLGGASYLIYLIHQPVGSVMMRLLARYPALPAEAVFVISAAIAVGVAIGLHLIVERPLLRKLNAWVKARGQRVH